MYLISILFLIQIGGAIVFVMGVWTLVDKNFLSELLGTNLFSGAVYVLVITSALVCLLSFFGCMGAAKEVKCMLLTVSIHHNNLINYVHQSDYTVILEYCSRLRKLINS